MHIMTHPLYLSSESKIVRRDTTHRKMTVAQNCEKQREILKADIKHHQSYSPAFHFFENSVWTPAAYKWDTQKLVGFFIHHNAA